MQLKQYFQQNHNLAAELLEIIDTLFEKTTLEKNEILLKAGDVSDKIYFVESGILREFSYSETEIETVITHWILSENEWIYHSESFRHESSVKSSIQALTKTQARYIRKSDFERLAQTNEKTVQIILKIYQQYLSQLDYRSHLHQLRKVEDRLELFEKLQPGLANRVPQFMIASFLNTTPSHLSKVRSKRRLKK